MEVVESGAGSDAAGMATRNNNAHHLRTMQMVARWYSVSMTHALRASVLAACLFVTVVINARDRAILHPPPPAPLDSATLYAVSLEFGSVGIAPGAGRTLRLYMWQCCVWAQEVKADIRFSMDPRMGATLDPDTGYLQIASDMKPGTTFRVYADIEHGRRLLSADVYVDSPASNPLLGAWRQTGEIACPGAPVSPGVPIELLVFSADRTFSVTWFPFEVYHDYWGFYTFNRPAGHLNMGIRNGNYVPPVFGGDGTYSVTEANGVRTLTLRGVNLGRERSDTARGPNCGAI